MIPTLKTRNEWREAIMDLPVFDTHTHMNKPGVPVAAQTFWDIAEYFWLKQELESVGYPKKTANLPETVRIEYFVEAFGKCRNTTWAMVLRDTFRDLYGVDIHDAKSIHRADEAVRVKGKEDGWPREVVDRLNVKRIVTNIERDANYPGLPGVGAALPIWEGYQEWTKRIMEADDPRATAAGARDAVFRDVAGIAARGYRGMRVHAGAFEQGMVEANRHAIAHGSVLPPHDIGEKDVQAFLAHAILGALSEQKGMFAQFFLGITSLEGCGEVMGIGTPYTVPMLYPLFQHYECDFELISGAPRLNMDIVQVARLYANVYAGGLWWYNFRTSTYRQTMQARLEAVPAGKCTLLASDGRCIEWCYAKTLLVKNLLADFLCDQVSQGWINEADALWTAREWLHDAAARRYV